MPEPRPTAPNPSPIRVLIVDDHPMLADGLRLALDDTPDIEVVAIATNAVDAVAVTREQQPDVVLVDYQLESTTGIDVAHELRSVGPSARIIMLTGQRDDAVVLQAVEHELDGYLRKTESLDTVVGAIRQTHRGETAFSARDLATALRLARTPTKLPNDLTSRELEVLQLMATGASTEKMAATLFVSTNTIRSHVRHILEKLDAHSKLEAVTTAMRTGILERSR